MRSVLGISLCGLVAAGLFFRPDQLGRVAAGLTAHTICSAVFVSGLDAEETFREHVRTVLGPWARVVRYRVDREAKAVEASFAGLFRARARFTPGYGARLDYPDNEALPATAPVAVAASAPEAEGFAPGTVVSAANPEIAKAIERVFAERAGEPSKRVKAVAIAKDGRLVAERYAPGIGIETPLMGYSVAKSFTNALLGVLVRQGRLAVEQRVGAPEWSAAGDPRGSVTIEDLLRMRSGIDAEERGSGLDPVARMEFAEVDMAGFAARRPHKHPPGQEWEYTSANTLILNRLIGQTIGGGIAGQREFAQRELFAPLGMRGVTLEFDGRGTFVGSTFVYATARDYARFGELYRRDGIAPDGRRILPEGWVEWSRRATLGVAYGAGFWTNDGGGSYAKRRIAGGFPADGFFASGFLGERIYIIPSERLVIVRLGYSDPPDFGIADDIQLIDATVRAAR